MAFKILEDAAPAQVASSRSLMEKRLPARLRTLLKQLVAILPCRRDLQTMDPILASFTETLP